MSDIFGRKADHLDLAATGDVAFRRSNLLEQVELVHEALPELDYDEIDVSCELLGKRLRAPILIAAMTGGTERAQRINLALAAVAEELGLGFGLGSQRAMLLEPAARSTFQVRDQAPSTLVLGNIGGVQATQMSDAALTDLVESVGADALCIHLNPAMELVQADGDRNFKGVFATIQRLTRTFGRPIVVKETGCGLSARTAGKLRAAGVLHVDVSGAGGTSWVAVEAERAAQDRRGIGDTFREWGIPTAATVAFCARYDFATIVATGGIASGLDAARAIALGASAIGIARPVLIQFERGGAAAVREYLKRVQAELRMAMLLCGARNLGALRTVPRLLRRPLTEWLDTAIDGA
jgi:isopentenyl-diphosphate delta-isomerase